MSFNIGKFNRYVTFETPTDVNTKGSVTRTWATAFSSYAMKKEMAGNSSEEAGKRVTTSKSVWQFPYNSAIVKDGRFYEGNATSDYYYITNVAEKEYQTINEVTAELRK